MKIAVFGLGYVGFTAACCMASQGHRVVGIDPNGDKVAAISAGRPPITEPGLEEMLSQALADELLLCATVCEGELDDCDIAIVCVGTPSAADGSHNMGFIAEVSRQIAKAVKLPRAKPLTVVYRSTIRPGTIEGMIEPIFQSEIGSAASAAVEFVYNPEFLRESTAVKDYFEPPKIVIGTADGKPNAALDELYSAIEAPRFYVRFGEAEFTKFVDNSWHAVKVAYANEVGRVCLQMGLDASSIHRIFVADTKLNISPYYTRPGGAFGGSCLPKDVRALQHIAADCGANVPLVDSLLRSNEAHKFRMLELAAKGLEPGASVVVSGLAFKANTDDLRESPNVDLVRGLLRLGLKVSIYDPAIEAQNLVGMNLGYAYSHLPELKTLLVDKEAAESGKFDRLILTNATGTELDAGSFESFCDLSQLR